MADTAWGRQVQAVYGGVKAAMTDVAVLKRIGRRQGAYLVRQNLENAGKGFDRNGKKLSAYAKSYLPVRKKHGRPTSPVDLRLKGDLYKDYQARNVTVDTSRKSGARIAFEIGVSSKNAEKLKGLTTGRLGKKKRPARDIVGLANTGTPLRVMQDRRMAEIGMEEWRKVKGVTLRTTQTAARGF